MEHNSGTQKLKLRAKASLTLLLVAVISITTATYAWFTLTNSTVVHNMTVEVSMGTTLKVDTAPHANIGDYVTVVKNDKVNAQLNANFNYELADKPGVKGLKLRPVTSGNGRALYTQSQNSAVGAAGTEPQAGYYLQLSLWFMSTADMNIYLNGDDTPDAANPDGTKIYTDPRKYADQAARLSITPYGLKSGGNPASAADYTAIEPSFIYEPMAAGTVNVKGNAAVDVNGSRTEVKQPTFTVLGTNLGLANGGEKTTSLFKLTANVPKLAVIRLWVEGEDPQCVNGNGADKNINLEGETFITRLRFCGADDTGNYIE
ncbi:MAG: hypothetical protein RRY64_01005 [Oscillospiraceae bacterium]